MKVLYFECSMGAAGDMLMAALLELHDNPDDFLNRLNNAGIPDISVTYESAEKQGITGTHVRVTIGGHEEDSDSIHHDEGHDHHHSHRSYSNIEDLIGQLNISDSVKKNAVEVYKLIAEAESHVHGVPVSQIHFHEVGDLDAVTDIVGVCMLIEELAPDIIMLSPINTGSGHVHCAHGILPVPAPATAYILQNIPIYNDQIIGELCTPTGAALLKYFSKKFCTMPVMTVSKLGYGMGKKNFEKANCVRAYNGNIDDTSEGSNFRKSNGETCEDVIELVCNLDDMTPEAIAFAQNILFEEGALDVYTSPIGMKKSRMGVSFTCMCRTEMRGKMLSLIFKHTSTLGIREYTCSRYTLVKEPGEIQTKFGKIRIKTSHGFGVKRIKPEYDDIAKIARENKISIQEVLSEL